ncbi:hypothetical protein, partial [Staphylococcus aureus]|uniref:hypothetical protein n=1 Tax=Staphylococcus aureus TaxID=1280 RepID=UPI001CB7F96E
SGLKPMTAEQTSGSSASPQLTTVCKDKPARTPATINNGAANLVIVGRRRPTGRDASPFGATNIADC